MSGRSDGEARAVGRDEDGGVEIRCPVVGAPQEREGRSCGAEEMPSGGKEELEPRSEQKSRLARTPRCKQHSSSRKSSSGSPAAGRSVATGRVRCRRS